MTSWTMQIHPAIAAQIGATASSLGRDPFVSGLWTWERRDEHLLGWAWPDWTQRGGAGGMATVLAC